MKLTGNQLFFITHIGVLIWATFVVWLAVVTKEAAIIALFFVPVLWLR